MQIIHCSPYRDAEGKPRADRKKEAPRQLGADWLDKFKAEDTVIETFGNHLDDDYYLICNVALLEGGPDADMLLFGPNGVWVFEFVHLSGSFKAEGEQWLALNEKTNAYEAVEPNPVLAARDNATAVYEYLHSKDLPVPWVNPVLVLTNPALNLFTEGAAAASIRSDEVYQFVNQDVGGLEPMMDENDVVMVYDAFRPFIAATASAPIAPAGGGGPNATHFMGMTTMQWVVILGIALANICLLVAFAWLLVSNGWV